MDFSLIGRGMKFFCRKPLKFQFLSSGKIRGLNFSACTEGRKNFSRKFVKTYRPSPRGVEGRKFQKSWAKPGFDLQWVVRVDFFGL
jgi:hypothetical protein